jgi:hypothetical protein
MSQMDVEKTYQEIQKIHDNFLQISKLYLDVSLRRWQTLEILNGRYVSSKNITNFEIKDMLESLVLCHNQEKRILRIINSSMLRTQQILNDLTKENKGKLKREEKSILNSVNKMLEYVQTKMPIVYTRMDFEDIYISNPSKETFNACYEAWEKEKKCNIKLLNMINPAQLRIIDEFKNNIPKIWNKRNLTLAAMFGMSFGGLMALYGVADKKEAAESALVFISLNLIFQIFTQYETIMHNIAMKQKDALMQFKRK